MSLHCRDNWYRVTTKDSLKKSMENDTVAENFRRTDCRGTDTTIKLEQRAGKKEVKKIEKNK